MSQPNTPYGKKFFNEFEKQIIAGIVTVVIATVLAFGGNLFIPNPTLNLQFPLVQISSREIVAEKTRAFLGGISEFAWRSDSRLQNFILQFLYSKNCTSKFLDAPSYIETISDVLETSRFTVLTFSWVVESQCGKSENTTLKTVIFSVKLSVASSNIATIVALR